MLERYLRVIVVGVIVLCAGVSVKAEVMCEAWVAKFIAGESSDLGVLAMAVDDIGNVYLTCPSGFHYATIKYAPDGETLWVRRYGGTGHYHDIPRDVAVDKEGNVYVTGASFESTGSWDYGTIKYSPNGDVVWVRRYNGPGSSIDEAYDLKVDDAGNVYVTGQSVGSGTGHDYATIKYAPNGDTLWVRRYNGSGNNVDQAIALDLDDSGNVFVTGWSTGIGTYQDYATIKYAPNGDSLWVRRYDGPGNYDDSSTALAVDASGNVYVTGWSYDSELGFDYATVKYAPNGDILWVRTYKGPGSYYNLAYALAIDGDGNAYVTGFSEDNYATIKYAPNGDTIWVRHYNNGIPYSFSIPYAVAVDSTDNIYVSGLSLVSPSIFDITTVKYTSNGYTLWARRYTGSAIFEAFPPKLALDNDGHVYVAGLTITGYSNRDYVTIKYSLCSTDLAVNSFGLSGEQTARLGEAIGSRMTGSVMNIGSESTSQCIVGFYLSQDSLITLSDSLLVGGRETVPTLGPGEIATIDVSTGMHVPTSWPPGPAFVGVALDDSNNLCECDESNNTAYFPITILPCLKSAELNSDGHVNIVDLVYLVNILFKSWSIPGPTCLADVNGDSLVTLGDIIYLANHVFKAGPAPVQTGPCCD